MAVSLVLRTSPLTGVGGYQTIRSNARTCWSVDYVEKARPPLHSILGCVVYAGRVAGERPRRRAGQRDAVGPVAIAMCMPSRHRRCFTGTINPIIKPDGAVNRSDRHYPAADLPPHQESRRHSDEADTPLHISGRPGRELENSYRARLLFLACSGCALHSVIE